MKRHHRVPGVARLATLACALLLAAPASAAEDVQSVTLESGVTVLLAPDPLASAVDVGVWWDGGIRLEKEGQAGLTYVLGRLVTRTPVAVAERGRRLEALGASTATIVQPDYLGLSTTVPPDGLDDALAIEAARLGSLEFSRADFAMEVTAVREERTRRMASPVGPGIERLYASVFGAHPYGRPVIGRDADLAALTYDAAAAHARRALSPGRAVITVVGRFEAGPVLERIRRDFARVPKAAPVARPAPIPMPAPRPHATLSSNTQVPLVMVGWRGPAEGDPDAVALALYAESLGASVDGLHSELGGPRGKVAQLQTGFDRRAQGSLLFVIAAVPQIRDSSAVERSIQEAVERAAREPLPQAALDRGSRRAQMSELAPLQTVRGRAQALVAERFLAGAGGVARAARLERVRADDVLRAAGAAIKSSRRATVWVVPAGAAPEPAR